LRTLEVIEMPHIAADAPSLRKPTGFRKWFRTEFLEPTMRKLPKTRDVLDLCCGYGFYFSINPSARGVDGDPACVSQLRARGYDVQLCNVLERLPFDDEEFQYVVAHDVLEHFAYSDLERIFAEVYRTLRPCGFLVAIQPNLRGFRHGLATNAGHKLFVRREHIVELAGDRFLLRHQYAEPLPRLLGELFTHNKEVYWLERSA
jgi:SAM-dependent methyltransferase